MVTIDARLVDGASAGRTIRRYTPDDLQWASMILGGFGGRLRISRGAAIDTATLPGLVALSDGIPVGLLTLVAHDEQLEIAGIGAVPGDQATVAQLLHAAIAGAGPGCRRVFTVCSNAELDRQRLLQQHGFRLCAVRPGAIARLRSTLPPDQVPSEIDGVPVTDEVEFEALIR